MSKSKLTFVRLTIRRSQQASRKHACDVCKKSIIVFSAGRYERNMMKCVYKLLEVDGRDRDYLYVAVRCSKEMCCTAMSYCMLQ